MHLRSCVLARDPPVALSVAALYALGSVAVDCYREYRFVLAAGRYDELGRAYALRRFEHGQARRLVLGVGSERRALIDKAHAHYISALRVERVVVYLDTESRIGRVGIDKRYFTDIRRIALELVALGIVEHDGVGSALFVDVVIEYTVIVYARYKAIFFFYRGHQRIDIRIDNAIEFEIAGYLRNARNIDGEFDDRGLTEHSHNDVDNRRTRVDRSYGERRLGKLGDRNDVVIGALDGDHFYIVAINFARRERNERGILVERGIAAEHIEHAALRRDGEGRRLIKRGEREVGYIVELERKRYLFVVAERLVAVEETLYDYIDIQPCDYRRAHGQRRIVELDDFYPTLGLILPLLVELVVTRRSAVV